MYESVTYESILQRMLSKIGSQYDKREGSIIMNALAPVAMELFLAYQEMQKIIEEGFADTQSRDFLVLRAKERGLVPKPASPSRWKAKIVGTVSLGARFSCGLNSFVVNKNISTNTYELICEQEGTQSNTISGELLPIDYIDDLSEASLVEVLVLGEDEEATEDFRKRYFEFIDSQAFGGNVADYKEKALQMDGVGNVKVIPVWDGAGTVKVIITTSQNTAPSDDFVESIQNAFDPDGDGKGYGLVPIGHVCTVVGVSTSSVDMSFTITKRSGCGDLTEIINEKIDQYLESLASQWGDRDSLIIRINQLETKLLEIEGVEDISLTKINNQAENYTLESDEIPVRGEISATFI